MNSDNTSTWSDSNQRYLVLSVARVRALLDGGDAKGTEAAWTSQLSELALGMSKAPALETLCSTFGLSTFERDVLLLCAGVELDAQVLGLISPHPAPTFGLALSVLRHAHWSALTPNAPLRHWRLIEVGPGQLLTQSPLRIDEYILHYLTGASRFDDRLESYIEPILLGGDLVPSYLALAEKIAAGLSGPLAQGRAPIIQLFGSQKAAKRNIAARACASLGLDLNCMAAQAIPANLIEGESLQRLWQRQALLERTALLLDCDELEHAETALEMALRRWIEGADYPLIVTSHERRSFGSRLAISFEVERPTAAEQRTVWQLSLGPVAAALNGHVDGLVSQFSLDADRIQAIAALARPNGDLSQEELGHALWRASKESADPKLGELAQRIEPNAGWNDLVLPQPQIEALHDIASQVRQRLKVYELWGFASKSARGLGISALFAGVSGTGKTMAAEVLANELGFELFRIDLSQVISKYIGESEKNLRRVFDAAEESNAILLFDEADALFGKRSEVKDSHDRYANMEVSYLLQRMEAYRGLAILTTNMKDALDQAFLRRIRFVVRFPFPDGAQRIEIWKRAFPAQTPTESLNTERLAKLSITGGNIANIAMHAAFLAADSGEPVRMDHLLRAARVEFAKLEKPLTEAEVGGWL